MINEIEFKIISPQNQNCSISQHKIFNFKSVQTSEYQPYKPYNILNELIQGNKLRAKNKRKLPGIN